MDDPFNRWLDAVTARHTQNLTFQELRCAVQALSSLYVERRNRIGKGAALDGAGKRAAFACYFGPLHFLLIREIVRALNPEIQTRSILDLGCGTGVAGAAWALEMNPHPKVVGLDHNPWTLQEAKWTYTTFGLQSSVRPLNLATFRLTGGAAVIAAFALNEMSEHVRDRLRQEFLAGAKRGGPILVIEAIAKRPTPWWSDWAKEWKEAGGIEEEWRFHVGLPDRLGLLDKASGLNHRELTARSLWLPGCAA